LKTFEDYESMFWQVLIYIDHHPSTSKNVLTKTPCDWDRNFHGCLEGLSIFSYVFRYVNRLFNVSEYGVFLSRSNNIYIYSRVLNFGDMLDTISVTRKNPDAWLYISYITICTTYTQILNETLIIYVKK